MDPSRAALPAPLQSRSGHLSTPPSGTSPVRRDARSASGASGATRRPQGASVVWPGPTASAPSTVFGAADRSPLSHSSSWVAAKLSGARMHHLFSRFGSRSLNQRPTL
ncbi:hypothetical protein NDU88_006807 [Pleurodeles waltl]|uniref:Uncharacterized protein n=1 Tax=Pleurodeles waltl TaxID=8319 RepID=A0AAV7SQR1_PLEWA|nr:hypothetical protein NDU88_006807 [Pleurodeles waltl]